MKYFGLIIISLIAVKNIYCGECPQNDKVLFHKHCICENSTNSINCGGNEIFELKDIFNEISKNVSKTDKAFDTFILNNSAIVELTNNTFNGITFKTLIIENAVKLTRIEANAFGSENILTIEEFIQSGESQLCGQLYIKEFFAALNTLTNLQTIRLSNNLMTSIPKSAFTNSFQNNLTTIDFNYYYGSKNQITSIEDNAFYDLKNLEHLYIDQQNITHISSHAFDFSVSSEESLNIVFYNSSIDEKSLETGVFTNSKRPLIIDLRWNRLKFLDEHIFDPILRANKKTAINVYKNPFQCDCRMYWIMKNRDTFENQIWNFICDYETITSFWSLNETFFDKCHQKY